MLLISEKAFLLLVTKAKQLFDIEAVRKNRSIYCKDSNPLGNKIHAVQKIKLYSKLPYGAYWVCLW
ncbi:hypothetical protein HMPREF1591_00696 [Escherichia coli 113303]|nr:hypothetical protein HMPREF1591_00696 [Escherichia coli 113303]